jgi:nucleoid-associated protein YgaU
VVFLVLAMAALHAFGRGPLAAPPVTRPGALAGWLDQRPGVTLAFCVLRLGALGLAGYLLATTVAGLVARIVGQARWSAAVDAVSPHVVRRLVQGAAGLTMAAAVTTTQAAAWATPGVATGPATLTPIMRRLPSGPPSTSAAASPAGTAAPLPARQATPDRGAAAIDGAPRPPPATEPSTPAPPAAAPSPTSAPATWVIRSGDNLWSVAEATLARAWGRVPSDADVDDYWTELIAVNRVRLAHGDDPDLVFPGQVFELPTPPRAGQS